MSLYYVLQATVGAALAFYCYLTGLEHGRREIRPYVM
jgi:hypothetical protein